MSMHQKYDDAIAAQAKLAFEQVYASPELVTQCKHVRQRIYEWLESISGRCKDSTKILTDEAAEHLSASTGLPLNDVIKTVSHFLALSGSNVCLVSRQENDLQWTPTSFFYDGEVKTLNVKIGNNPYQPVGFDDGTILVQLEGTKLLWARQWALTPAISISRPFHVIYNTERDAIESSAYLDDASREALQRAFKELQEELGEYLDNKLEDRNEAEFRLRETVKLARIMSNVLDSKLKLVLRERSGLGPNFENSDIVAVAKASLEYISARLDAHEAATRAIQIDLVCVDDQTRDILRKLTKQLRAVLIAGVVDIEALDVLLTQIAGAYEPANKRLIELACLTPIERAKDLYDWIAAVCNADRIAASANGSDNQHNGDGPVSQSAGPSATTA